MKSFARGLLGGDKAGPDDEGEDDFLDKKLTAVSWVALNPAFNRKLAELSWTALDLFLDGKLAG